MVDKTSSCLFSKVFEELRQLSRLEANPTKKWGILCWSFTDLKKKLVIEKSAGRRPGGGGALRHNLNFDFIFLILIEFL